LGIDEDDIEELLALAKATFGAKLGGYNDNEDDL